MSWSSIKHLSEQVRSKKISASELVEKSLAAIEAHKEYNAIISVCQDEARKRAKQIDHDISKGKNPGRLAGVPFIAKDNFLAFGAPTTAASKILGSFNAPYQATAINLLEAEGAILVAKANLDSFAHGSSTENSAFGPTLNPSDKTRVPGGSSGGSGAAVALEMAPFALGTDTGGSIRLPASYCGVVGYKPTYGLVSRYGVVAMASSTDVIGPLTKTVDDASEVMQVIAGRDIFDSTTIASDNKGYIQLDTDIKGKNIGVIRQYFDKGLDPGVEKIIRKSIKQLEQKGAIIHEVDLPAIKLALACYYIIVPAEVSSNLSRYDGQRYGLNVTAADDLDESYCMSREMGFEPENKRRIMMGAYVLSSGYYDAYYRKAQIVRTKLINELNSVFEKVDFLVGPTAPSIAFKLGENTDDPLKMYLADVLTVGANLAGIPAISVPAGKLDNMPVGFQLMAPQRHDRDLLALAKVFEESNK